MNRTSFICGNRNGNHNTELKAWWHIIGQHKKVSIKDPTKQTIVFFSYRSIISWLYHMNIYCIIRVSYWLYWITWPTIIFDSMICDGIIIDYVIDMTRQYWLHPKTKWPLSPLKFQKARVVILRSRSWVQSKFYQNTL